MALTLSGTNGVVGAGFTVDASGVSVTAGVGTFSSVQGSGANLTALPAANLTGVLPALNATSLTSIPAANIVGLATAGFERSGGFGGGKLLQVQQTKLSTQITVSTSTETEVLSCAITPASSSNKILTTLTCAPCYVDSGTEFQLYLYRDSSFVYGYAYYFGSGGAGVAIAGPNGMYLDTPNTTSEITYRVKLTRRWGSNNCYFNHTNTSASSTLTLMEIET